MKKENKCLMLMLNLKVSKQTRSEASKNKAVIKRIVGNRATQDTSQSLKVNIFVISMYPFLHIFDT